MDFRTESYINSLAATVDLFTQCPFLAFCHRWLKNGNTHFPRIHCCHIKFCASGLNRKAAGVAQESFSFLAKTKESASALTSPYLSYLHILAWEKIRCLIVGQPLHTLERKARVVAERVALTTMSQWTPACSRFLWSCSVKQIKPWFRHCSSGFPLLTSARILSWFKPKIKSR